MNVSTEARAPVAMSVDRSLHLLGCFSGPEKQRTLTELCRLLEMPKSTVFRLLSQLTDSGYLERVGRKYRLSLSVFELGNQHAHCGSGSLRDLAAPHLAGLFQHTGLSVHLGVQSGSEVVVVDRIRSPRSPMLRVDMGQRLPVLSTALGKAMIAHQPGTPAYDRMISSAGSRRYTPFTVTGPGILRAQLEAAVAQGFATDKQETVVGVACIAAPVLSADGGVLAAVSVSGQSMRFKPEAHASLVRRAADLISRDVARLGANG